MSERRPCRKRNINYNPKAIPVTLSSSSSTTKKKKVTKTIITTKKRKKSGKRKGDDGVSKSEPKLRKARSKTKKPKYKSLSKSQMIPKNNINGYHHHYQQVKDEQEDDDVAGRMFVEEAGVPGPTTLTGLLSGAVSSTTEEEEWGGKREVEEGGGSGSHVSKELVRVAMKGEERERSGGEEERWVSMSEVVERGSFCSGGAAVAVEEEVTSGAGVGDGSSLKLKLDYEDVLNVWSGMGTSLYVDGGGGDEVPQTVPDLNFLSAGDIGLWTVPETSFNGNYNNSVQLRSGANGDESWKIGLREASVLRYKEKRQNRLFSKRIRYEVRKLNAEKRPRIKGRFVKRSPD